MSVLLTALSIAGFALLFLLKLIGVLLLVILVLLAVLLLIPFCADVAWEDEVLTVRAGAMGLTFPFFQYPKPEPPTEPLPSKGFWGKLKAKLAARRTERKRKKAEKKPPQKTAPRKKAKITLNIILTILHGAGRLLKVIFGQLKFTKIRVCIGVRGEPDSAAYRYGKLNAVVYPTLGYLDHFFYLDFEELRILPDFSSPEPTVKDRISFRVSARALFIVLTLLRVLYEFWREKVLDVFL